MRLAELRKDRGLGQQEVADSIGIPVATYRKYEYGQRQTPMDVLMFLADFYGVTLDYIAERAQSPDDIRRNQLVALYRMLDDDGRNLLLTMAKTLVKSGDYLSLWNQES